MKNSERVFQVKSDGYSMYFPYNKKSVVLYKDDLVIADLFGNNFELVENMLVLRVYSGGIWMILNHRDPHFYRSDGMAMYRYDEILDDITILVERDNKLNELGI